MTVPSDVSDTDLAIFQHLANPKRVDFNKNLRPRAAAPPPVLDGPQFDHGDGGGGGEAFNVNVGGPPPAMYPPPDHHHQEFYGGDAGERGPPPSPPPPPQLFPPFSSGRPGPQAQQQQQPPHTSRFAQRVREQTSFPPPGAVNRGASALGGFRGPPPPPRGTSALPAPYPLQFRHQPQQQQQQAPAPPQEFYGSEDEARRIKQRLLGQVAELKRNGYVFETGTEPTMEETVEEIQFKLDHGQGVLEMKQAVSFMKDGIPMVYNFMEMANNKWGPFLPIQGFTDELLSKMDKTPERYNYVLERVYRRYWRKGSMSPAMEFLWVFVLPIILYIAKRKIFGAKGGNDTGNNNSSGSSSAQTASVAPEPPRTQYSPPQPSAFVPPSVVAAAVDVGPSVRPQPPPTGNYFPPPMMAPQPPPSMAVPLMPNIQQPSPPPPPSATRKRLKPLTPSFAATQPILNAQPVVHSPPPPPLSPPPQQPKHPQHQYHHEEAEEEEEEPREQKHHLQQPQMPMPVGAVVVPSYRPPPRERHPAGSLEVSPAVELPPIREDPEEDDEHHSNENE